jgi:hypothetical protein
MRYAPAIRSGNGLRWITNARTRERRRAIKFRDEDDMEAA